MWRQTFCEITEPHVVRELTGVPVHHPSPIILREWYHFVQGTLRNHISDVTRKKWDSLLVSAIFQNGRRKIWDFQHLGNYFMQDHDLGGLNLYFLGHCYIFIGSIVVHS